MLILTWPCHSSYVDDKLRRKWQPLHAPTPAAFYHSPTPTALTPRHNTDDGGNEKAGTSGRAATQEESGGKEREEYGTSSEETS
ncbi:hypothetical protein Acr_13g0008780 [Actinidia rufa]|uniref:Uncharacterized protein n=1 Tax=Actinidia rufa TaxID=165716 RepID=A0A7J0FL80_9ERIC|nr:hypothetical protein Acr_13g0008780 [Actinidia rufa]